MTEDIPTDEELTSMLATYFVGATPVHTQRLRAELTAVLADPARHAGEAGAFDFSGGGRRYFGQAWRELLSYDRRSPRPIDLAAYLAATTAGFPPVRPYCPEYLVGTWTADGKQRWQFLADGTFVTDDPMWHDCISWCVHRQGTGPDDDALWLDDDLRISHERFAIRSRTPTELVLKSPGTDLRYRLVRT